MQSIFSAGVYFGTGSFSNTGLSTAEGNAATYVKDFCSHNYPQSASTANLASLMSHNAIASQIAPYAAEIAAAAAQGKFHIMGETNSGKYGNALYRVRSGLLATQQHKVVEV